MVSTLISWGNGGDVYDYYGEPVDLPAGYATFIEAMKAKNPTADW